MGQQITLSTVKRLKPGEIAWDGKLPGFGIRCQRRFKIYILKARQEGRPVWLTIGKAGGAWTPATARKEARRLLTELDKGTKAHVLRKHPRGAVTVASLADRYIAEYVNVHNKPRTRKVFAQIVESRIKPDLGRKLAARIDTDDIAPWHHGMKDTPRQANHALAVLSVMLKQAMLWGLRPKGANPCKFVKRYAETERDRHYTDAELKAAGEALKALETEGEILPGGARAIRLAALTGMRQAECLALKWADIDLQKGAAAIRDAKAGDRTQTLGAATVAYLDSLQRDGEWVCWGVDPRKPLSASMVSKAWGLVRKRAGLKNAHFHDLRHTVGTYAGSAGANAFLVRDTLGHRTLAMTAKYVGKETDPLKQLADRVSGRVAAAMAGETAAISPMKRGRRR